MLLHPIVSHLMSLGLPDKAGAAANVLLAAGAVLLKPALDSLLISGFPSLTTLGGRVGDVSYSKGLTLLGPVVKWYQHHDTVVPFLRTTKPILSSMPLLQPSSMTAAASGVMYGTTACFLSLVAAVTFLVRSQAGSEPGEPGGRSSSSSSETGVYNRDERQAQNGRTAARRSGRREPPEPMPPNDNQNNTPTEDVKPPAHKKRHQVGVDIQVGAPPPPPPPPPPPAAVAVHPNDMGRKAVMNVFWKCLLGVSLIILYVKSISTSDCSYTPVDDILIDWDNTSSSMLPNLPEPMELQHFPVDVPSRLRPLLARFQVIHKAICGFVTPPVFASPCLFLRLAMDYLLCTLLCWILSSICALASGSACNGIHQAEEDEIVTVEVSLSQQCILQLPCEDIPPQVDQLEDLWNPEQLSDAPDTPVMNIAAEDITVVSLPSEPGPPLADADPPTRVVERRCEDIPPQVDQLKDLGNPEQVSNSPSTAVITVAAENNMVVLLPSEPGPSLADADPPTERVERRLQAPGRTRRIRPRRRNRSPGTRTVQAIAVPS